jgi:hypothetical protein
MYNTPSVPNFYSEYRQEYSAIEPETRIKKCFSAYPLKSKKLDESIMRQRLLDEESREAEKRKKDRDAYLHQLENLEDALSDINK